MLTYKPLQIYMDWFYMTCKNKKHPQKKQKFHVVKNKKEELRNTAFSHPHPDIQRKCFAVLLLSFLFSASLVALILGISAASVRNYWNAYQKEGVDALKIINHKGKKSALHSYAGFIEQDLTKNPPSSIAEAAARIEKLTGVKRGVKAVRVFLRTLKFRYRKTAGIPAKADAERQRQFLDEQLNPLLNEAAKGLRVVLFMDAAHFVHAAFLGFLWSIQRIFVKSPSGRKRFNVLGAVNAITKQLHVVTNETYINAIVVCDLLKTISKEYMGQKITLVMDNARYQKCALVMSLAAELKIDLLFLPPYSPNLNIIERLWKFVKKKSLNSRYYETFGEFQKAISGALHKCGDEWKDELKTLLVLNFQMFSLEENEDVA